MARSTRSTKLETRSARLRLPVAKKPVFVKIGPSVGLGYRRNQTAGTWVARVADGKGGNWTKAIGTADDSTTRTERHSRFLAGTGQGALAARPERAGRRSGQADDR